MYLHTRHSTQYTESLRMRSAVERKQYWGAAERLFGQQDIIDPSTEHGLEYHVVVSDVMPSIVSTLTIMYRNVRWLRRLVYLGWVVKLTTPHYRCWFVLSCLVNVLHVGSAEYIHGGMEEESAVHCSPVHGATGGAYTGFRRVSSAICRWMIRRLRYRVGWQLQTSKPLHQQRTKCPNSERFRLRWEQEGEGGGVTGNESPNFRRHSFTSATSLQLLNSTGQRKVSVLFRLSSV